MEGALRDLARLLFSASGRLSRLRFFGVTVGLCLTGVVVMTPFVLVPGLFAMIPAFVITVFVDAIWALAAIRRLHDRNRSGWWLLIYFAPMFAWSWAAMGLATAPMLVQVLLPIGGLGLVIWICAELFIVRGTVGGNRYGPDPLAVRS
jgi:uncharacterized membrane protein YhaH (DUF805 family)